MNPFNRAIVATLPLVPKPVVRRVASRYVAGETLDDALATVRRLERRGLHGDPRRPRRRHHAPRRDRGDRRRLPASPRRRSPRSGLDSNVSVKLTALGLKLDPAHCRRAVRADRRDGARPRQLRAHRHGGLIGHRRDAADLLRVPRASTPKVGIVLQAYLRRSREDARRIAAVARQRARLQGHLRRAAGDRVPGPRADPRQLHAARRAACSRPGPTSASRPTTRSSSSARSPSSSGAGSPREAYEFQMLLGVAGGAAAPARRPRGTGCASTCPTAGLVRILRAPPEGEPVDRRARPEGHFSARRGRIVPESRLSPGNPLAASQAQGFPSGWQLTPQKTILPSRTYGPGYMRHASPR